MEFCWKALGPLVTLDLSFPKGPHKKLGLLKLDLILPNIHFYLLRNILMWASTIAPVFRGAPWENELTKPSLEWRTATKIYRVSFVMSFSHHSCWAWFLFYPRFLPVKRAFPSCCHQVFTHRGLFDCWVFLCIVVGSLPHNTKLVKWLILWFGAI